MPRTDCGWKIGSRLLRNARIDASKVNKFHAGMIFYKIYAFCFFSDTSQVAPPHARSVE